MKFIKNKLKDVALDSFEPDEFRTQLTENESTAQLVMIKPDDVKEMITSRLQELGLSKLEIDEVVDKIKVNNISFSSSDLYALKAIQNKIDYLIEELELANDEQRKYNYSKLNLIFRSLE